MKQFYTFLILVFAIVTAKGQVINFPDANFKAKLLASNTTNTIAKDLSGNYIKIDSNNDGEIDVNEAHQIQWLEAINQNSPVASLITNLSGIENFVNLKRLSIAYNAISAIDLSSFPLLEAFFCQSNQITTLDFTGLTHMTGITAFQNQLTSINVNGLVNLVTATFDSNQLTTVDFSSCISLNNVYCSNNQLVWIDIKNGKNEANTGFGSNPNLTYICADEGQLTSIQNLVNVLGYTNCHINSYCTLIPGGTYYTIQGSHHWDATNNGCDTSDFLFPNLKYTISNGTTSATLISREDGSYFYDVLAGSFTVTPVFENPTYFTFTSPTSGPIIFPNETNPYTKDFCIVSNGVHNDLEVVLLPIMSPHSGSTAFYRIVCKNNGTHPQSGIVNFGFEDAKLDFVSATPTVSNQAFNMLSWDFSNLLPFETRIIEVTLRVNSPSDTPPVNIGDLLGSYASIEGASDERPIDNLSTLKQTVVNALDPNDKTCLEGTEVSPSIVGEYVHYIIRFENTGSANAQNIVVKDMIDTSKYDISSLMPLSGSASFVTRITNTNKVEFIFEDINLPFDDTHNDGYVAFKIKTKPTLVVGDTFSNTAAIYFDYNFPITTNTATTSIQTLGSQDFEFNSLFSLSPVPAKSSLTITTKQDVVMSSVIIYNTLGQLVQVITYPTETIDVSGLQSGSYFIRITSDKGSASGKFIKE